MMTGFALFHLRAEDYPEIEKHLRKYCDMEDAHEATLFYAFSLLVGQVDNPKGSKKLEKMMRSRLEGLKQSEEKDKALYEAYYQQLLDKLKQDTK